MKRNRKEEEFKAYLRRLDDWHENSLAQRALGYKELEKPIHYGYEVYWVLRDDIARREDADTIQDLVDAYTRPMWCRNADATAYSRRERKLVNVIPERISLPLYRWQRVPPSLQLWFDRKEREIHWGSLYWYYCLSIPPYWLVPKVKKYYKTHYKVIDEVLLQEEAEIKGDLWGKYYKYYMEGAYYYGSSTSSYNKINNRTFRKQNKRITKNNLDMIKDEEDSWYVDLDEHTYKRDKW